MSATTEAHGRPAMPSRYAASLRVLHWLTALLILGMFVLGVWIRYGSPKPDTLAHTLYNLHESTGVTLWLLVLLRIGLRLAKGAPKLPPDTPGGVRALASLNQFGLYVLLFVMPVLGFLDANSAGAPLVWYEAVPVPSPIGKQSDTIAGQFSDAHWCGALLLFLLLVLHIAGAAYHGFIRRDDVVSRMA